MRTGCRSHARRPIAAERGRGRTFYGTRVAIDLSHSRDADRLRLSIGGEGSAGADPLRGTRRGAGDGPSPFTESRKHRRPARGGTELPGGAGCPDRGGPAKSDAIEANRYR